MAKKRIFICLLYTAWNACTPYCFCPSLDSRFELFNLPLWLESEKLAEIYLPATLLAVLKSDLDRHFHNRLSVGGGLI